MKFSNHATAGHFVALLLALLLPYSGANAQTFTHPGCLSTQADLNRMATKVAANEQPWKAGYDRLASNGYAQLGHTPNPQATLYASGSQPDNYIHLARDVAAAYQVALRYHVTGDTQYAAEAVSILMAWANTHTAWNGNTNVSLRAGLYGYQLACAGELVRNYSGWSAADFNTFKNYVRTQFYRYVSPNDVDRGFLFHHHGTCWSHYWANWELASMATVIATGVLLDDQAIFNEAIDYFYNGVGVGRISELLHYCHPNGLGQSQEFGRDQGHATMLVPLLGTFCEIAWNQGIDFYSELGNAFLTMSENLAKHNLYYDVPYVSYVNCEYDFQTNIGPGQGSMRPGWDLVYNHYVNRMGMSAPYSKEAAEQMRPEGGGGHYGGTSGGFDQLGFTTLTHSLDPIASGALPSQLRPHVKGGKITLSWRGSAYAKSYNVKRATTSGGPYTTIATVDKKNTFYIDAGRVPGTTYYYVVSANNPGGESANITEISATHDGQIYGALIGTDGSWNNAGARKEHVFDGSLKNFFDPPVGDAWAGLDLGSGVSAVITQVKYCPRENNASRMVGGKFQGSNTADFSSGVVDLFTITSTPPYDVLTTQTISNGNSFRYVRYIAPAGGGWCNVAEAQFIGSVTGMTAPASAPSGLNVSSPGNGQVALTWNAVSGATDYVVKRATAAGGPYTVVDYSVWGTNYTDRKLLAGTYYYVVSALNSLGETADSAEQSITVLVNVGPGSTITANDDNSEWSPGEAVGSAIDNNVNTKWYTGGNTGASGWLQVDLGSGNAQVVTRYDLTSANDVPNRDPKNWELLGSKNGTSWTTLDTRAGETFATRFLTKQYAFTNNTAYRYYKLNILSNFSGSVADGIQLAEWALWSAGGGELPPAPTGLSTTAVSSSQINLSWTAAATATSYNVKRSITNGGPYTTIATGVGTTSYSDTGLSASTTYYYVVSAVNAGGESANSTQASATTQTNPPAAPTGLNATAVSSSQINLTWTASSGAASYNVKRATTNGGPYSTIATGVGTTNFNDTGLSPSTTYYYVVSAVNSDGEGANSTQASATTLTDPPAAPTGLSAAAVSSSQINLTWNASSGASSYNVKRSSTSGGPYTTIATGVGTTSYSDTGLSSSTTYYYVVSAANAGGESANSAQASATTQLAPPAEPTGLNATAGDTQVSLSWTAASGASSYNVKRATVSGGPYTTIASGVTQVTYADTGLTNGTTYHYVVSAMNAAGESGNSAQASATPAAGLPSPWANSDIGAVAAAGAATHNAGTFTIDGSGADIAGSADEFHYVYQTASGDCSITARIAAVENTNSLAKAGVMIRETTANNSREVSIHVTPASGLRWLRRSSTGGNTSSTSKTGIAAPQWLRVTRTGDTFRAYYSANGTSWTQLGNSASISMGTNVNIGIAVTSRSDGTLCTATVDNVTVTP